VQLPNYEAANRDWSIVQEAMLKSLAVHNTGMAVTVDIGEAKDIHPKNKQDVGKRLSLWALATVYGKDVPASGPLPTSLTIREGRSNNPALFAQEAVVSFKHVYRGLAAKEGALKGFEIAELSPGTAGQVGVDFVWRPAHARIEGNTVVVSSPAVKEPVAVRYAWDDNPVCNLYNGAGLPASPFRLFKP
jgi:sialate O-acetylesterase